MLVVAFDPGLTTGYALADFGGRDGSNVVPFHLLEAGSTEYIGVTLNKALYYNPDVLIVEDFVGAGQRTREAIHTLKLVGALQFLEYTTDRWRTVVHQPQWRKGYVAAASDLLRSHPTIKYNKHAADAVAHLFAYHARTRGP